MYRIIIGTATATGLFSAARSSSALANTGTISEQVAGTVAASSVLSEAQATPTILTASTDSVSSQASPSETGSMSDQVGQMAEDSRREQEQGQQPQQAQEQQSNDQRNPEEERRRQEERPRNPKKRMFEADVEDQKMRDAGRKDEL